MKKVSLLGFLLGFLCLSASDAFFVSKVTNIYSSYDDTKVYGRLLPTSEVLILEEKASRVKVKIKGFSKIDAANAIYFLPQRRILVAGLSKKNPLNIKTKSSDLEDWEEVEIEVFIQKEGLLKDIKALFKQANVLFKENCSICHPLHPIKEFTANQWPSMIKAMSGRTALTKDQIFLVIEFLQKHAKDMKGVYHE